MQPEIAGLSSGAFQCSRVAVAALAAGAASAVAVAELAVSVLAARAVLNEMTVTWQSQDGLCTCTPDCILGNGTLRMITAVD